MVNVLINSCIGICDNITQEEKKQYSDFCEECPNMLQDATHEWCISAYIVNWNVSIGKGDRVYDKLLRCPKITTPQQYDHTIWLQLSSAGNRSEIFFLRFDKTQKQNQVMISCISHEKIQTGRYLFRVTCLLEKFLYMIFYEMLLQINSRVQQSNTEKRKVKTIN